MNVAVCFSGTVRCPENGLNSLKLIFPNDNIKVFGHTWSNIHSEMNNKNQIFETNESDILTSVQKFNFETLLIENYKTKRLQFEKIYDYFKFEIWDRSDMGIISMFYSMYRSNSLKRKYEVDNKIKFDRVIRMRFDSDFKNKNLNLENIFGHLCIPSGNDWYDGINDQFAVGSSGSMDVYCDLYNSFSMIRHIPYHPESMLREYLTIRNIDISRFDFDIGIISQRLSWDQR